MKKENTFNVCVKYTSVVEVVKKIQMIIRIKENIVRLREDITKKCLSFGQCPKGGGEGG